MSEIIKFVFSFAAGIFNVFFPPDKPITRNDVILFTWAVTASALAGGEFLYLKYHVWNNPGAIVAMKRHDEAVATGAVSIADKAVSVAVGNEITANMAAAITEMGPTAPLPMASVAKVRRHTVGHALTLPAAVHP